MSSTWRNFFSYNKYSQITARAIRNSLKEDQRLAAEKRGMTSVRFQRWEGGVGGTQTLLSDEVAKGKEAAGKSS